MSEEGPYNESEIIALVTEYYKLILSLNYLESEYISIDFPPAEGRKVDEELCKSLNLKPKVISLMRHLPCPDDLSTFDFELFIPRSHANSFVDNDLIKLGRDPEGLERLGFLKDDEIALTVIGDEGACLILDTEKNTIRACDWEGPFDLEDGEEESNRQYDFDPEVSMDHYTRYPIHHAPKVLKLCIDKIRTLVWIPRIVVWQGIISRIKYEEGLEHFRDLMREEYGWPDSFQQEKWNKDYKRVFKEVDLRLDGIGAVISIDSPRHNRLLEDEGREGSGWCIMS